MAKSIHEMQLCEAQLNIDVLMRDVQLALVTESLPIGRTVLLFQFTDIEDHGKWYLVAEHGRTEVCDEDRALDVDVYVTCERETLAAVFHGEASLTHALDTERIRLSGSPALMRAFPAWFGRSPFAPIREAALGGGARRPA